MPTSDAALTARAEFDRATNAMAQAAIKGLAVAKPAPQAVGEQPAAAPADTNSQPSASETETQPAESPTADPVAGDVNTVDSSATADEVDASDDSESVEPVDANAELPAARPKTRSQVRIEALAAEKNALKAQVEYLQQQVLTKLQPAQSQPTQAPSASASPAAAVEAAPTLESCSFDTDKWTRAMHAWTEKRIAAGVAQAVQTVQQNQTEATRRAAFESRMTAFQAKAPDLQVVLGNPALPQLSKDAAALVVDSEVGPQILYHLGKNADVAARIARQTPMQQAAAIGRLEAQFSAARSATQKTPINSISRAPAPPTPTRGGGASGGTTDITKMPIADMIKADRERLAARRQRVR